MKFTIVVYRLEKLGLAKRDINWPFHVGKVKRIGSINERCQSVEIDMGRDLSGSLSIHQREDIDLYSCTGISHEISH